MAESADIESDIAISKNALGARLEFLNNFVDSKALHFKLEKWLEERFSNRGNGHHALVEPFKLEELRQFDYALENSSFQQGSRMPVAINLHSSSQTGAWFAVEDFLHSAAQGLWRTFWCTGEDDLLPFFVAGINKQNNLFDGTHCAALVTKCDESAANILWEHIAEVVLLGDDLLSTQHGIYPSPAQISRAVFYALHLLLSRKSSDTGSASSVQQNSSTAFVLFMTSQGGGVIKVGGDVDALETNTTQVYESAATWVQLHANIEVSTVDKVWNKFGSVNWRDIGALQLIFATFCCMEQFIPPKRSASELATQHGFRLLQRAEQRRLEVSGSCNISSSSPLAESHTEIEEVDDVDENENTAELSRTLMIEVGTILWLEDSEGSKGFEVHEDLSDGRHFAYTVFALEDEAKKLLNVYIGAHPAQLEPSWEDMNTWYQVQRQARVLNAMKQRGLLSRFIPELVLSGELLHPGTCVKQSSKGHCDHPWCGLPVLVTSPVGESLFKVFNRNGILSPTELLECCHDCLSALQSAQLAGIQHANVTPEHVHRVLGTNGERYHVLVDWGHAVLEDKDRPATSLSFSPTDALQEGKICPVSDIESLIYVLFYLCGGILPQFDSVESALQWRVRAWARRAIQQVLGESSIVLKAFADYVDNLCGTPYAVDYGLWLSRLDRVLGREQEAI